MAGSYFDRRHTIRGIRLVLLLIVALAIGIALGAARWRGSAEAFHREARMTAILDQARQMEPGGVVVIGDSITERNRFITLCGRPALNAGIAWSTAADWLPDARRVVSAARPLLVILAVGINDPPGWEDSYRQLVRDLRPAFAIAPADPSKARFVATLLPTVSAPPMSADGKHPDAAGAAIWRAAIEARCRAAMRAGSPQ